MLRIALAVLACVVSSAAAAQAYPSRPIRMVVPFAPGGTNELLARLIGQKFQEKWGQPVIPENRPGAGGNIGADVVAKSAPDGYTLLFGTNTLTMNPFLVRQIPFDVQKDLAPVAMVATTPFIVVVNNDLPVRSIAELIALREEAPGQAVVRHARKRHAAPPRHRDVQDHGRRRHGARSLQGLDQRADRRDDRTTCS